MSYLSRTRSYQGGPYVEVFSSQGRDPFHNTKVTNKKGVRKIYDKSVRGYVIYSSTSASARLHLPKDDRKALRLSQSFFVVQVFVPVGQAFSIAMNIKDKSQARRRLHFSSAFSDIKATPLHCQIPLISLERGKWLNLVLNVSDFVRANFAGQAFQCIDSVEIGGISKIRKIFTLREQPFDTLTGQVDGSVHIPRNLDYPSGVMVETQILDSDSIKDSEGVKKLREATNQIRPLTEPLVKEMDQSTALNPNHSNATGSIKLGSMGYNGNGNANANSNGNGKVRLAFGTRLPKTTSSPPKGRKALVAGLEISISDEKAPSGPTSPVIKLPTVLSPRAKTSHLATSSLPEVGQRGGVQHSRRFERTLPLPTAKGKQQSPGETGSVPGVNKALSFEKEHPKAPTSLLESELMNTSLGQSLLQTLSPPQHQKVKKPYSKFRYSDYTSSSRGGGGGGGGGGTQSNNSNQPLEDIPLNKQCGTASSQMNSEPKTEDDFEVDASRSNWESLYTDQSMQTPGRPVSSRISLLPISSQYDMFGDSKSSFVKRLSHSHSKSDSMSSDTSERVQQAEQDVSSEEPAASPVPVLRTSVEFRDTEITSQNETSSSDRDCSEKELDYGMFNVDNTFTLNTTNTPIPELQACPSEILDEPVCIHDAGEEELDHGEHELRHSVSLDPIPKASFSRQLFPGGTEEKEEGEDDANANANKGQEVPVQVQVQVQEVPVAKMDTHSRIFDIQDIIEAQLNSFPEARDDDEAENDVSSSSLVEEEEEPGELIKVDEAIKRQREMINKHRIFTPPVIPASKVYENDHLKPGSLTLNNSPDRLCIAGDEESLEDAANDDGNTMMDLIYDPILNCYYDAKANRYYELK